MQSMPSCLTELDLRRYAVVFGVHLEQRLLESEKMYESLQGVTRIKFLQAHDKLSDTVAPVISLHAYNLVTSLA